MDTRPSITGSVPTPKINIYAKPSTGVDSVMQNDSARNVRPQGNSPFSPPRSNIAPQLLSLMYFEKVVFNIPENLINILDRTGILIPVIPTVPINISTNPKLTDNRF